MFFVHVQQRLLTCTHLDTAVLLRLQVQLQEVECEALRIQAERQQQAAAAHRKLLSAFLKHRARAQHVAAQQQRTAAVVYAWQRQVVQQVCATWAWRELAQQLLQLQQPQGSAAHGGGLRGRPAQESPACVSTECSWEDACAEDDSRAAGCGLAAAGDSSCSASPMPGQPAGSFMQRLMLRRRDPAAGSSCRAAAAAGRLLAAAWRAWHVTARLARRSNAVEHVSDQQASFFWGSWHPCVLYVLRP